MVKVESRVTGCDAHSVTLGDERIPAATIIWASGVKATTTIGLSGSGLAGRRLRLSRGRVRVEADFGIPCCPDVVGDTTALTDVAGQHVPGVAPAAKQAGRYVGRIIQARLRGEAKPAPFRYRNLGNLAIIGRRAGVADFGWISFRGPAPWWLWGIVHIIFLNDFHSRVMVSFNWPWSFLTYKRGARLITGDTTGSAAN